MTGPSSSPVRGVRRVELTTADPEPVADFYAALFGWVVIAEPEGVFSGWVGDRLATRVLPAATGSGEGVGSGFRVVFAGARPRGLREGAAVDRGRVLHGPWAPPPRAGEPCWVEFAGRAEDDYWTGELGWRSRTPDEPFTVYDTGTADETDDGDGPGGGSGVGRAVAGRCTAGEQRWRCYFAVPDVAKTAALAAETGGLVVAEPEQGPTGLAASVQDPCGAVFAVLQDPPGWGGAWHIPPA